MMMNWMLANGFELRRLGSDHRHQFQHHHHTTSLANRAAFQVASSELLYRPFFAQNRLEEKRNEHFSTFHILLIRMTEETDAR